MLDAEARAAARDVLDAIAAGDAERLRLALHPYLHYTQPDGTLVRGRRHVLALLDRDGPPDLPREIELRDGQVYRWTS